MQLQDALLGEHALIYRLLEWVERQSPGWDLRSAREAGQALSALIQPHARSEDELLFPHLAPFLPAEAGPLAVMRLEHEEIESTLARIEAADDESAARALLLHLVAVAREHFLKEEKVLFPMASSLVGAERLGALGQRWAAARGVYTG